MILDKFKNPIFNDNDIFEILYKNNLKILPDLCVTNSNEIVQLENIAGVKFKTPAISPSIQEFDTQQQSKWMMPQQYYDLDITKFCIDKCKSEIEIKRVKEELDAFDDHELSTLLKWLIYFVDMCNENKIVLGVGRGSSVSSYVLYLIGVHKINSIRFNLDWREFLR